MRPPPMTGRVRCSSRRRASAVATDASARDLREQHGARDGRDAGPHLQGARARPRLRRPVAGDLRSDAALPRRVRGDGLRVRAGGRGLARVRGSELDLRGARAHAPRHRHELLLRQLGREVDGLGVLRPRGEQGGSGLLRRPEPRSRRRISLGRDAREHARVLLQQAGPRPRVRARPEASRTALVRSSLPKDLPACGGPIAGFWMHDTNEVPPPSESIVSRDRVLKADGCADSLAVPWGTSVLLSGSCRKYTACSPENPVVFCEPTGQGRQSNYSQLTQPAVTQFLHLLDDPSATN